jgi:hypothetical protein
VGQLNEHKARGSGWAETDTLRALPTEAYAYCAGIVVLVCFQSFIYYWHYHHLAPPCFEDPIANSPNCPTHFEFWHFPLKLQNWALAFLFIPAVSSSSNPTFKKTRKAGVTVKSHALSLSSEEEAL